MNVKKEQEKLQQSVSDALELAKRLGASAAEVAITKTEGINIGCRMRDVETVEFNHDGALGITVYRGQRKGSASTADLSSEALQSTVKKALEIAKYTSEDDCAGPADESVLEHAPMDLALNHPCDLTHQQMIDLAIECESVALQEKRVSNSDGASFSSYQGVRVYGNSHGQLVGYPSSRHSLSCGVIAEEDGEMQRDYDYTVARDFADLKTAHSVGKLAAENAVSRLGGRQVATGKFPVLFHRDVASGLLGHFVAAISGGNIYRRSSFLLDAVGQRVFPDEMNIVERPFIKKGLASSPFDAEGVAVSDMDIVTSGVLNQFLLTSYSARKLGLQTNGHAGGIHNWLVEFGDASFEQLLEEMGTGLLVTELMGQGVNIITGDYSRGAAGFWVENGKVQFPVQEITIAGNLKEIFQDMLAVGTDRDTRGSIATGSILIREMQIAGA